MILNISRRENPRKIGFRRFSFGDDIAVFIHVYLPFKYLSIRLMSYGYEYPADRDFRSFLGLVVDNHSSFHQVIFPFDAYQFVIKFHFYIRCFFHSVSHCFGSTEIVFSHKHSYFTTNISKISRLFCCRVPCSNYDNFLVSVKKSVTSSTRRNSTARVFFLIIQPKIFGCSSSGNNHSFSQNFFLSCPKFVNSAFFLRKFHFCNHFIMNFGVKSFGLFLQIFHHFWSCNSLWIPWEIVHFRSRSKLTAMLQTCIKFRF